MYKYDGFMVYQGLDDEGVIEVVEQNNLRSLHFGSDSRQSSLDLTDPESLQLPYAKAMTIWRLFNSSINKALIIGLGGGSLARYLLYHYSDCQVTAVEYRSDVVKVARSYFGLPLDARMKVIVGDGGSYVKNQALTDTEQYDLIIIDAFDVDGLAGSIASIAFFDACKQLLTQQGLLLVNLWESEKAVTGNCLNWLERIFNDKVLKLPVRNRGNLIAIAFNQQQNRYELKSLKVKAKELEGQLNIQYPVYLKDIIKNNAYTIHSVINK
jgi:spermidine synthase